MTTPARWPNQGTDAEATYTALVAETGFDPASLPPIQPYEEREAAHLVWMIEAGERVANADLTKQRKPRAKKATA
ncbi:MAG TPA: hypothetical protein VJL80_06280 [Aeromicrobium sp.]|nr:hypothetical protein [Aeromicrobium sp.]HKY57626.1 hypothetical protein [Aeromicrobium sp.]